MSDYSDRKIEHVAVRALERVKWAPDTFAVLGIVRVEISSVSPNTVGPHAIIELSAPCDSNPTIEDAERALLTRAHAFLERLASTSAEELHSVLQASREPEAEEE